MVLMGSAKSMDSSMLLRMSSMERTLPDNCAASDLAASPMALGAAVPLGGCAPCIMLANMRVSPGSKREGVGPCCATCDVAEAAASGGGAPTAAEAMGSVMSTLLGKEKGPREALRLRAGLP